MTLDKLPIDLPATIVSVGGETSLRCRLLDMGLIPKTKIKVVKIAPLGDPIQIRVRDYELSIRIDDAKEIEVSVL